MKTKVDIEEVLANMLAIDKLNALSMGDITLIKDGVEVQIETSIDSCGSLPMSNFDYIKEERYKRLQFRDMNQRVLDLGDYVIIPEYRGGEMVLMYGIVTEFIGAYMSIVYSIGANFRSMDYKQQHSGSILSVNLREVPLEITVVLGDYYTRNIHDPFDSSVGGKQKE